MFSHFDLKKLLFYLSAKKEGESSPKRLLPLVGVGSATLSRGAASHAHLRLWRRVESLPMSHTRAHHLRCRPAILIYYNVRIRMYGPCFAEPGHRERIRGWVSRKTRLEFVTSVSHSITHLIKVLLLYIFRHLRFKKLSPISA